MAALAKTPQCALVATRNLAASYPAVVPGHRPVGAGTGGSRRRASAWRRAQATPSPRASPRRLPLPVAAAAEGKQASAEADKKPSSGNGSAFVDVEVEEAATSAAAADSDEDVGEVEKILGSRVVDGVTQYLIQWKDEHPDSWEPQENISPGIIEDYIGPWWVAAKKGDDKQLKELLESGRDPNAVDDKNRTALFFCAGFGHEKAVEVLLEGGAEVEWFDAEGYTPLHMAAGYVHGGCVKLLLDAGADPEAEDAQGRSSLSLAKDLLEKLPNNPLAIARRMALDAVVKMLDEAVFEEVEVQQVLDRRIGDRGVIEFLVRWSDESEDSWEPAENIGDDLIRDYEQGLEYGVAEKILEKREEKGIVEYLVKWEDSDENTWEPLENLAVEIVAEFEGVSVEELEKKLGSVSVAST